MTIRTKTAAFATGSVLLAVSACGGSSGGGKTGGSNGSSNAGNANASNQTITIGVLSDITGPAASGNKTILEGIKAGAIYAARHGYTIKYKVGDTATSPSTALAAAQKLTTQDHVLVVVAHSALAFAAAPYLTAHKMPVVGVAEDGPEWTTSNNMFSVYGAIHTTRVNTTTGLFLKKQGVSNLGTIGYSISPSSSEAAKAAAESAKSQGIKVGYLNASFPFGSTDVAPVALAMKKAGVDGFTASTDPNTAYALISALREQGVQIKAALLATGYGGDLQQAGPGALQAAQNVFFNQNYQPIEMNTPATRQFAADLKAAGVTTDPTYAEYNGYLSIGLLVQALQKAGSDPSQAQLMSALSSIHDFDGLGLYGGHKLDVNDRTSIVGGVDNCGWYTQLEGDHFKLVDGAEPICGTELKGVTVSPSS